LEDKIEEIDSEKNQLENKILKDSKEFEEIKKRNGK